MALIDPRDGESHPESPYAPVAETARTLRRQGQTVSVLAAGNPRGATVAVRRAVETALRARGFSGSLGRMPTTFASLLAGRYDMAHAFSAVDVLPALLWRRFSTRPIVFTCSEVIDRSTVAGQRLRLEVLSRAVAESNAVLAADLGVQRGLSRWLAVEAALVDHEDGEALMRAYGAALWAA